MNKVFRLILFIPAMYIGLFLSIIITAIWNIPLTFLEWLLDIFGDWSLLKLIFGIKQTTLIEITYILSSGIFMSLIGLYLALLVFPHKKHRNKIVYLLLALLLIGFSSQSQMDIYNSAVLYYTKIIGILIGFGIILGMLKDKKAKALFSYIDKKIT